MPFTPEQELIALPFERNMRGWVNDLARLLVAGRALQASNEATGGMGDIVPTLDPGDVIPNSSGLAGAQPLTQTDWNALIAGLANFITTYDTLGTRQRIAQAAGPLAGVS